MEFPVRVVVTDCDVEIYSKTLPDYPLIWYEGEDIGDVEEFISKGREVLDLYEVLRSTEPAMLLMGLEHAGLRSFPQLAEVFKKVEEERWEEITKEEEEKIEEALNEVLSEEWELVWRPEDVEWTPKSKRMREIYHRKYSYDQLMAMTVDEIKEIARIKGIREGRKEEMARAIHLHDYGEEEARSKLAEIERMLL